RSAASPARGRNHGSAPCRLTIVPSGVPMSDITRARRQRRNPPKQGDAARPFPGFFSAGVSPMGQSSRVPLSDLRQAYRLIHECRDLGHDPTAWSRHAARALAPLVGAQVVLALHIQFGRPGGVPDAALLHGHGWSSPRHWAYWYKRYVVSEQGVQLPALKQFATLSGPLITRTREQLVDDAAWYGSAEFQELFRSLGCDDFLVSFRRWDDPLSLFGFTLIRPLGEKRHGGRERRLVHLFMDELSRHLGAA